MAVDANLGGMYALQIGNAIHHYFAIPSGTNYTLTLPFVVSRGLPISIVPPSGVAVPASVITFNAIVVE